MNIAKHSKHQNQVRITGGQLRGRKIHFASAQGLRPTPDMVREKLFNWLGQDLTGKSVLDLFSGSGALGFEAASRQAKQVLMCEHNRQSARNLQQYVAQFQLNQKVQVLCQDALIYLQNGVETFDLVLLDPPFMWQQWEELLNSLKNKLNPQAYLYIEAEKLPTLPEWLSVYRQGRAGKSHFVLTQIKEEKE